MKALCVPQPLASAIMLCGRNVHNLPIRTDVRGPVLIHAGSSKWLLGTAECLKEYPLMKCLMPFDDLPRGALIGTVEIEDCLRAKSEHLAFPWASGPFICKLRSPRIFGRPVYCAGRPEFWEASESALGQIAWIELENALNPKPKPKAVEVQELSLFQ